MSQADPQPVVARSASAEERTLRGLVRYFLKLGSSGFGGPIALAGYMRRDLVEERGWFTEAEYQQGLAVAQTMPGPLAAQLAMWLGYLEAGALGAKLSGAGWGGVMVALTDRADTERVSAALHEAGAVRVLETHMASTEQGVAQPH